MHSAAAQQPVPIDHELVAGCRQPDQLARRPAGAAAGAL